MRARRLGRLHLGDAVDDLEGEGLAVGSQRQREALGGGRGPVLGRKPKPLAAPAQIEVAVAPVMFSRSLSRYANGTRAIWNALGFRGPLVPQHKRPGAFRMILLGESTTHGYQVDDDQTIDVHMRALLRERYPGIRFEVVNLALDGYDSYQIYERLKSDGLALSPDLVIVNAGINDVRNARFPNLKIPDPRTVVWEGNLQLMREEARRGGPSLSSRLTHYSYAARFVADSGQLLAPGRAGGQLRGGAPAGCPGVLRNQHPPYGRPGGEGWRGAHPLHAPVVAPHQLRPGCPVGAKLLAASGFRVG